MGPRILIFSGKKIADNFTQARLGLLDNVLQKELVKPRKYFPKAFFGR
jgi:hypothetical protein